MRSNRRISDQEKDSLFEAMPHDNLNAFDMITNLSIFAMTWNNQKPIVHLFKTPVIDLKNKKPNNNHAELQMYSRNFSYEIK